MRVSLALPEPGLNPEAARIRTGPRTGVAGPGGDGEAYPWRFWLEDEPTVSPYKPAVPRRRAGRAER
ncbi:3-methyladenine DNA glycosylase domain protein [Actinomyces massiliensis F0489]|uniref:3-methyladenine DNA glycosylase domain protein n=1 Tax=Actinomyces massiliensis F0489 TaxID=1125718 RepID=J1HJK5_9ACTO|nr:3-methyladenine DNA glycosylase domain protein [Actinomyces massiliensis F0489]